MLDIAPEVTFDTTQLEVQVPPRKRRCSAPPRAARPAETAAPAVQPEPAGPARPARQWAVDLTPDAQLVADLATPPPAGPQLVGAGLLRLKGAAALPDPPALPLDDNDVAVQWNAGLRRARTESGSPDAPALPALPDPPRDPPRRPYRGIVGGLVVLGSVLLAVTHPWSSPGPALGSLRAVATPAVPVAIAAVPPTGIPAVPPAPRPGAIPTAPPPAVLAAAPPTATVAPLPAPPRTVVAVLNIQAQTVNLTVPGPTALPYIAQATFTPEPRPVQGEVYSAPVLPTYDDPAIASGGSFGDGGLPAAVPTAAPPVVVTPVQPTYDDPSINSGGSFGGDAP